MNTRGYPFALSVLLLAGVTTAKQTKQGSQEANESKANGKYYIGGAFSTYSFDAKGKVLGQTYASGSPMMTTPTRCSLAHIAPLGI